MQHGLCPPHGMFAGAGLTKIGRAKAKCSRGQQECVFNPDVCLALWVDAESTSGAPTSHNETSTNATAMNLVFIQARQSALD